jgi:amidase
VAVQRLIDAGAIVFGKTNTPAWAMDWQTYNDLFGTTRNPWNPERTCGGSSGGSAASVAAGFTSFELGSDIGGSIRIPSGWCGVFGHKPSWGIVPERGHIPGLPGSLVEEDINVVGPLARSVEDLELVLDVIAGPLDDRGRAWRLSLPAPRAERLRDFRVGAWLDDAACPIDTSVLDVLNTAVEKLRGAGASIDEGARPPFPFEDAVALYQRMLAPIISGTLSDEQFQALVLAGDAAREEASSYLDRFTQSVGIRHRDWLRLHQERERMRAGWAALFEEIDVLLCPVAPLPPIAHDHADPQLLRTFQVNGRTRPYTDLISWMGAIGVAWLPVTVVPAGHTPEGLPVGIQIVAPFLEDRTSLRFGRAFAAELGGYRVPPGYEGA